MAEPGNFKFRERWCKQVRSDPQVTKDRLAVALLISTEARGDGTRALMSQEQLAKDLGVSVPTIERRIRELKELGYLEVAEKGGRRGDGTVAANVYNLSQPITHVMDSGGSQPITQMMDRDSQQGTQMTHRDEISIHQNGVSTHQNGLLNPSPR
jgi:DNA-binding transcriptional MocR family regulator